MSPNDDLPPSANVDAWLDALAHEDVRPMPAADAAALRTRVVERIDAQRAELALRSRARGRRRTVVTFAAAACLPLVVWGGLSAAHAMAERRARANGATIVTPGGPGSEVAHAGEARPLDDARDAFLASDDELHTGPGATARASLPTGAVVDVGPSARLRFERELGVSAAAGSGGVLGRGDRIELLAGKIDVQVPKLAAGDEVRVHTSGATVVVHGTRFSVERADARTTRVVVAEGRVSVTTSQGERMLTGGSELLVPDPEDAPAASGTSAAADRAAPSPSAPVAPPAAPTSAGPSTASPPSGPSSTLSAENALLAEALRQRRDGQTERALVLLDELLDRYPRSPLAETARGERRRALDELRARGARP